MSTCELLLCFCFLNPPRQHWRATDAACGNGSGGGEKWRQIKFKYKDARITLLFQPLLAVALPLQKREREKEGTEKVVQSCRAVPSVCGSHTFTNYCPDWNIQTDTFAVSLFKRTLSLSLSLCFQPSAQLGQKTACACCCRCSQILSGTYSLLHWFLASCCDICKIWNLSYGHLLLLLHLQLLDCLPSLSLS